MTISIRARFRNAMVGLSLALCMVFTVMLFVIVFTTEDQVFVNQLKAERKAYEMHQRESAGSNWTPSSRRLQLVQSRESLPKAFNSAARDRILAASGIHEYFDAKKAYFVDHFHDPTTGASLFLIFDVSDLLAVRGNKLPIFITILLLTFLVTVCAIFVAHRLVKRTLEPVRKLSNELQHSELNDVVIELANEFTEDEIGILAHELAAALSRAKDAAQREFEFNRGISHELRSPIQVAQSTTELLELRLAQPQGIAFESTQISEYIERLKRAMIEMNEITEAFLWLASDRKNDPSGAYSVAALNNSLTTIRVAYPTIDLSVKSTLEPNFLYPFPEKVGAVIVRSLLRNALSHGRDNAITLTLTQESIEIKNYVNEDSSREKSFGIGLSIVQRVCERFGCQLSSNRDQDGIHIAAIYF